MLKFIANWFKKPVAPTAPTPYKVEAPVVPASEVKKPTVKKATKPAVKKATTRKPKAPKA